MNCKGMLNMATNGDLGLSASDFRLWQGDCLEEMKRIPDQSVDMVMCDPPYGTTACKWDSVIPLAPMWEQLKRVIKPNGAIVMTASQPFTTTLIASNMGMFKQSLAWDKVAPRGFLNAKKMHLNRHEDVLVFYGKLPAYNPQMETRGKPRNKGSYNKRKGDGDGCYGKFKNQKSFNNEYYPTSILKFSNALQKGKLHPTQKPVALMEYLIKTYTNEGETVLDFTMGSGTTGVACVNLNREFIGIERDDKYFEIAKNRIGNAKTAQRDMFTEGLM
jgi:site-specific DNA-methyltransferase (adenine-specific)